MHLQNAASHSIEFIYLSYLTWQLYFQEPSANVHIIVFSAHVFVS